MMNVIRHNYHDIEEADKIFAELQNVRTLCVGVCVRVRVCGVCVCVYVCWGRGVCDFSKGRRLFKTSFVQSVKVFF